MQKGHIYTRFRMFRGPFRLLFILLLCVYVIIPAANKKGGGFRLSEAFAPVPAEEARIFHRTNLFERFHTPSSRKLMEVLYPSETGDFSLTPPPESPAAEEDGKPISAPEKETVVYRLDISKKLPVRSVTDPNDKAADRLREAFLKYLNDHPEKIPLVQKKKSVDYRPYVKPTYGDPKMHAFFKAEQRLEDEEQKFWEDEIRERSAFINAENNFFKLLGKSEQRRILQDGAIVMKAPLDEKDIRNAAFAAVVKNRLKRRKLNIPDDEFFIYLNALKTAEKNGKPSVYVFNNSKGYRIVYPENYFPAPDERLDLSVLRPSQKAAAETEFQNYKEKTGVLPKRRNEERARRF